MADPFEFEAYYEQHKRDKLEAERASRITVDCFTKHFSFLFIFYIVKGDLVVYNEILIHEMHQSLFLQIKRKLPKVNRTLAARLFETEDTENEKRDDVEENETKKSSKKKKGISMQDLEDDRFKDLFTNEVL